MSLHHKLCHILGGTFNLPHAETHTVVLPYALNYNAGHAPDAMAALQRATGAQDPVLHIRELAVNLGGPRSLRELGLNDEDIDTVVELATHNQYANPRPLTATGLRGLLTAALNGDALPAP